MSEKTLSVKDIKELAKEHCSPLGVRFDVKEFTSDVNDLVEHGIHVRDAMNVVALKTVIDYAHYWQDTYGLYDLQTDPSNANGTATKQRIQSAVDYCTDGLEGLYFDMMEVFSDEYRETK